MAPHLSCSCWVLQLYAHRLHIFMDKIARCSGRLEDQDLTAKASIQTTSERRKYINYQIGYSVGVQNLKSRLSSQSLP